MGICIVEYVWGKIGWFFFCFDKLDEVVGVVGVCILVIGFSVWFVEDIFGCIIVVFDFNCCDGFIELICFSFVLVGFGLGCVGVF